MPSRGSAGQRQELSRPEWFLQISGQIADQELRVQQQRLETRLLLACVIGAVLLLGVVVALAILVDAAWSIAGVGVCSLVALSLLSFSGNAAENCAAA
jgi:hypothetical protein